MDLGGGPMADSDNQDNKYDPHFIAQRAIQRIKDENLSARPEIYELFYVYYSGDNSEVTRSIDIMVAQNFELTEDRCLELYRRYLDNDAARETLDKAERIVGDTLSGVDHVFDSFKETNQIFSGSLQNINTDVLDAVEAQQFKSLLATVISEAQRMVSENLALEKKLEKSSSTMQQLKEEMEMIREEAYTDSLTGIPNRKKFDLEVIRLVAEARDEASDLSLIFIDIDHFKSFNDTYGHQIGDQVLRLVARAFRESLKGQDFFCRYGGEEFVIALPKTSLDGAGRIAEILRESIMQKDIKNKITNETLTRVTISAGVAELRKDEEVEKWISRADKALYRAKKQGRNCVVLSE